MNILSFRYLLCDFILFFHFHIDIGLLKHSHLFHFTFRYLHRSRNHEYFNYTLIWQGTFLSLYDDSWWPYTTFMYYPYLQLMFCSLQYSAFSNIHSISIIVLWRPLYSLNILHILLKSISSHSLYIWYYCMIISTVLRISLRQKSLCNWYVPKFA